MEQIYPAFQTNNTAVCFIIPDGWIKYLSVAIQSLIDNSSSDNNYDIIIICNNIQPYNQKLLSKYNKDNISLRIITIADYLAKYNWKEFYTHHYWGREMYYRVFLPEILSNYSKVLYCDADILLNDDIAKLYNTDMKDAEIGVCVTVRQLMNYYQNKSDKFFYDNILKLKDMNEYFNSGVLLMNLESMRQTNMIERFISTMKKLDYLITPDQDIFNVLYNDGGKMLINIRWNHIYYANTTIENNKKYYTEEVLEQYLDAQKNPGLIHFAGNLKPWLTPYYEHGNMFWNYARKTDYYEEILISTIRQISNKTVEAANYSMLKRKIFFYKLKAFFTFGVKKDQIKTKRRFLKDYLRDLKVEFPAINKIRRG